MKKPRKSSRWMALALAMMLGTAPSAWAAIAYDSFFVSTESTTAADITVACTPVGTPKGVLVFVTSSEPAGVDQVVGVTYGGTAMTEVTGSPLLKAAAETMATHAFFLGSSVATGVQNCVVDRSSTSSMRVSVILLTAGGNTEIVDQDVLQSDSVTNPSLPVLSLAGRTCFVGLGFTSGSNLVGQITPRADWTERMELDPASAGTTQACYTFNTVGSTDVTPGWDSTGAEDANAIAVAIAEVAAGGGMTAATRTSGTAPLLVIFDAGEAAEIPIPAVNGSGDPDPGLFHYAWNFGDTDVAWSTSGKNKNTQTGYVVAHVFETPGTYTTTLTLTDAADVVTTWTEVITVSAFSGTELYVSPTGNDGNNGLTPETAWLTATKAESSTGLFAANGSRRLSYAGGNTYDCTSRSTIGGVNGPFIIRTTPGTGANAIIRVPASGLTNGTFGSDTSWTKGVRWAISGGVATATGAGGSGADFDMVQSPSGMTTGNSYTFTYTATFPGSPAGTIQVLCGTAAGTARAASGNFTQSLTCAGSAAVTFRMTTDWNGSIDDVTVIANIDGPQFHATATDVRLVNVDYQGPVGTARSGIRLGYRTLVFGCNINIWDSGISLSEAHGEKNESGVVECTIGDQFGGYCIFYEMGKWVALLGNTLNLDDVVSNEHNTRLYLTRSIFAHNKLGGFSSGKTMGGMRGFWPQDVGLTNRSFATDTIWTKGTGWTISGGAAVAAAGSASLLSQTASRVKVGDTYTIVYDITRTAGTITPQCGSTGTGTARSLSGTYQEDIIAATDNVFAFNKDAAFAGTVTVVSVKSANAYDEGVGLNDSSFDHTLAGGATIWTLGTGWSIAGGTATASAGSASLLSQTATKMVVGDAYLLTYTMTRSAGTLTPFCGSTGLGVARSLGGTYTETVVAATDTTFGFSKDASFAGTVTVLDVQPYNPSTFDVAEYNTFADNIFKPTGSMIDIVVFGPTNTGDNMVIRNTTVERNYIFGSTTASTAANIAGTMSYFTIRNNIFDVTDRPSWRGLRIYRNGTNAENPTGNRAYGNSILCNTTFTGEGIIVGDTNCVNNVVVGNAVFSTAGSGTVFSDLGTTTTASNNTVYAITDLTAYVGNETGNFSPITGAAAIGSGLAVDYLYDDLNGYVAGNRRTAPDKGAVEFGSAIPAIVGVANTNRPFHWNRPFRSFGQSRWR